MANTVRLNGRGVGLLAGLALSLALAGCSTEPDLRLFTVEYAVSTEGQGFISELFYDNGRGELIADPDAGDEWSTAFAVPDGGSIYATAEGTVQNGEITLSVTVTEGARTILSRSDSCSDVSGEVVACSLSIPFERFP